MTEQEHDPQSDAGPEGVAPTDDPELDDETVDDDDAGAADADEDDQEADEEDLGVAASVAGPHPRDHHPAKAGPAAPSASEIAVHVSDRASGVFVIAIVGLFVAILLYGMLLGHNGLISGLLPTPIPTPTPIATSAPSPIPSDSPVPSGSSAASASPAASPSAAPSSAAPSPSAS